jgi:hypothetical protein
MQPVALQLVLQIVQLSGAATPWQTLAPGVELGSFEARAASEYGDSRITILRIDPTLWDLTVAGITLSGESEGMTASEWSQRYDLAAAINAGMFSTDYRTHVGYLRFRDHVNNGEVKDYQSVAAFDSRKAHLPPFRIFDLDAPDVSVSTILQDYSSAVQNLRLIKRPARLRWAQQAQRWSEAALGEDASGRMLFIFSRSPYTMHDLCQELLHLGIALVAAQHLEGGPEAQLYVNLGGAAREWFGSYETSFRENDTNDRAWPIPNVIGIRPRRTPPD